MIPDKAIGGGEIDFGADVRVAVKVPPVSNRSHDCPMKLVAVEILQCAPAATPSARLLIGRERDPHPIENTNK